MPSSTLKERRKKARNERVNYTHPNEGTFKDRSSSFSLYSNQFTFTIRDRSSSLSLYETAAVHFLYTRPQQLTFSIRDRSSSLCLTPATLPYNYNSNLPIRTNKRVCGIKKIIKVALLLHERLEASFFNALSLVQHIQSIALHYTLATMRNHDDRLVSIPVHIVVDRIRHQLLVFAIQRPAPQLLSTPITMLARLK